MIKGANRLVLLAAIPLFLILAFVAFLAVQFAENERTDQASVLHTYRVRDQIRQIQADLQDIETGQRGYLITHDPTFLVPYKQGVVRAKTDLQKFRDMTRDNPTQQERAGQLAELIRDRIETLEKSLALAPAPGMASPDLMTSLTHGRDVMDKIQTQISGGLSEEERLLDVRMRSRHQAEANEINTALAAAIVAFLLLVAAALVLVRNNFRLGRSEEQRTRERNILQTTLDSIRDGVVVFDASGSLAACNKTFFEFFALPDTLSEMGTPLSQFRSSIGDAGHKPFFEYPAGGIADSPDAIQRTQVGERALDIYRSAVPGGGMLLAAVDVTSRVRAEEIARQSQKMEAIGHLTGGVAHDFNNLLQIVSANLDLAATDMRGNPKTAQRLQNAIGAVERGSRLTGQLLAFARRQALAPRSLNLSRLVPSLTDLLRRTLGERIEVEAIVAGGLWNTSVDVNQLENAVINLAVNSRDAMSDGGKLTIEVANAYLDDSYAAQHAEVMPGQYIMLAVSDTGHGMPPEVVTRVFEPFFTTKAEGQGTGLGLSQVYGFVKQSGGHVKIYSEVGHGTTIKLYLPRTRKAEESAENVNRRPIVGGQETLLVVEDDEGVRAAVVDMLSELGYSVLKAPNAEEALTVLRSGVKIDLLFTDVVMPGALPTRELARRAQDLQPGIAVLFTSGYTQNAIVHNGKLDDDVFLLSKPYRKDDLARKLRSMLDGRKGTDKTVEAAAIVEAAAAVAVAPAVGSEDKQPKQGGKLRALVVEDVALIRMTTVDMMEELGFETLEAGTGTEALELLKANPDLDVLLTDLGLPGMSGGELSANARALRADLKIIIASGYSAENASEGVPEDALFLQKPFDLTQLKRVLES
ncbi:MAG TPA: CHASE3 domain-containing protein [Rhizomicrobium sp.]|nr:CHASE3 domain-containing protein [Rhizomicrobium sp.]